LQAAKYLRQGLYIYSLVDTVVSIKDIWRDIHRFKKKGLGWDAISKKLNRRGARSSWQKRPWTKESAANFYRSHKDKFLSRTIQ